MDEKLQRDIQTAMGMLGEIQEQRFPRTDQRIQNQTEYLSDKATDPPMNHGDGIGSLQGAPGPSSKAKAKRLPKRISVPLILRENLHREAKSIAKEKIRDIFRGKRTLFNPIAKKSKKRLKNRVTRKKNIQRKKARDNKKKIIPEKKKRVNQSRVLRLSSDSCDSESSVTAGHASCKGSIESSESETIGL